MGTFKLNSNSVEQSTGFKCKRCASCCSLDVLLDDDEIRYFGETVDLKWCTTKKLFRGSSLVCCYLKGKKCMVYEHRPRLCRAYPFSSMPESDVKNLDISVPSTAMRIRGEDGNWYLITYDDECPGVGEGDAVDWQQIVSLTSNRHHLNHGPQKEKENS
ncbi:MAG: YkgJ family cysteine cluster protein [Nitrososphaeria archaeon]